MKHNRIIEAFIGIEDKNALAWSILDTKSELAVSSAIALSANRKANKRVAYVERARIDLSFANQDNTFSLYEAKAAYFTDFQPNRIAKNDWYLGKCIDDDLLKLEKFARVNSDVREYACLFYLYENTMPHKQSKYGKYPSIPPDTVLRTIEFQVSNGKIASHQIIDCGIADEAEIKIHLVIFDPL
jgi:hypothetical protein